MNGFISNHSGFNHEVMSFGNKEIKPELFYSADSLVQYSAISNRYNLVVTSNSILGYYTFLSTLIDLCFGIMILWLFKKIFSEADLIDAFKQSIYKRLNLLAILFIASDLVGILHYIIFNNLLHNSILLPRFELITDVGNGFITGLIIYAIAIIYQRGLSIQEEIDLTV